MKTEAEIQQEITDYSWGTIMSPETRAWIITDIQEQGERPETEPALQEMSDGSLFLLWLRS